MTTTTVVRPLGPSEEIYALGEVYIAYIFRTSGRLDIPALNTALAAVVRAFPLLGARIEATPEGGHVFATPGAAPEVFVTDGDPERPLTGARLDQTMALVAVCVVRDGDTASVSLLTHHSSADAFYSLAVLDEFWSCYTDAVEGGHHEPPRHPVPDTIETLLAARGIEKIPRPSTEAPAEAGPAAPAEAPAPAEPDVPEDVPAAAAAEVPAAVPEVLAAADTSRYTDENGLLLQWTARTLLTEADTAALVALGHREGLTINALVSAAILRVEAELRSLAPHQLMYVYPVNLRTRLVPEVGLTEGTNVVGFADYVPAETTDTALLGLARAVNEALRTALADGMVQQAPLHIPEMLLAGRPPEMPGLIITTNWGRVAHPRTPAGLRVTDFRSTTTAKPDETAGPPAQPGGGTWIISGFDGRLSIEIHHPEANAALQRTRVDRYAAELIAAVSVGAQG
ncbi:hypothetical protein [Nocardia sp. NPDC052566]|uniref:phthiocerol/phthiodiolone dimycocerosyl transferase family protein n=1 Tax=Nocardia sp. NPDC052566 TaxID=3364330 RepID=UPI0037C8415F